MLFLKLNIQRFAASAEISSAQQGGYDITNNKTTERITFTVTRTSGTTYWASEKDLVFTYTYKDDSNNNVTKTQTVQFNFPSGSVGASKSTYIDVSIPHKSDGSQTLSYSAKIVTGTGAGTLNPSGSRTLTTIPRASEPTLNVSSATLGSTSVVITTNRKSSSFTHTITTKIGNTVVETFTSVGASKTFTPSIANYAPKITSATSATCVITCITYNGSTQIGSAKTVNLTLNVPSSVVPSISSISINEADSTMKSKNWGVYVQGKSKLSVSISASGVYGSSISSYSSTANGSTYAGSSFTTGTLTGSGSVVATVKDSRGRSASKTQSYTVVSYSNPTITSAIVSRCLADGTDNEDGTYLKYTFKGNISPVNNKNTYLYQIGYKLKSESEYTYITLENATYTIDKENIILNDIIFDNERSYDIIFNITDAFTTTSINREIMTSKPIMDFNNSGKAMAIGKISEADDDEELLEIAWETIYKNLSLDEVILNAPKLLWRGDPLSNGNTVELSETAHNFKFLLIQPNAGITYIMAPVMKNITNTIRGSNNYVGTTNLEIYGFRGTLNTDGTELTQDSLLVMNLTTDGNIGQRTNYTGASRIYGLR